MFLIAPLDNANVNEGICVKKFKHNDAWRKCMNKGYFKYSELKLSAEIEWEESHCGRHFYIWRLDRQTAVQIVEVDATSVLQEGEICFTQRSL